MGNKINELKEVVSQSKSDTDKRLGEFEKRLIEMEHRIWPKGHLYAVYIIVAMLIGFNFFLTIFYR
jgi:hypothetical protein